MSIEQLANVDVTSVTKSAESLSDAPGSIYVITHDDIIRAGATSVPEALRLAPNLQVARRGAADWVITARGMSGNAAAQNFPNKLLVLIDGRSVYTPLYSGVYWDMQDVLLADIDRIEVISGPGATLWGANAVNGVINIITRDSSRNQGLLADLSAGDRETTGSLRYGGRVGTRLTYDIYARGTWNDQFRTATGAPADDAWSRGQGGFRVDWADGKRDRLTLQGDLYAGNIGHPGPDDTIAGRNVTMRWRRADTADGENGTSRGNLQVQLFYDHTMRSTPGSGRFGLDAYDLDVQRDVALGKNHRLTWGGGVRVSSYRIDTVGALSFAPSRRTLFLGNAFVQDRIAIGKAATLIVGIKAEDDPYSGVSILPSVRGTLKLGPDLTAWAAVSRAVRSPTPFDTDVVEAPGGTVFLTGDKNFRTEKLTAYEAGLRGQIGATASFSLAGFYNVYDDLRSIEFAPAGFLPLRWGNRINARTWGIEANATVSPASWWRLTAGYSWLHEDVTFDADASGLLGPPQVGDDPRYQASLRSAMDLGPLSFDAGIRRVGTRPDPRVPAYTEADARLAWKLSPGFSLFASGQNLLHAWHIEYADGERVPRAVLLGFRWQR
ncbi:MAG: TonB-dependent receptor plug domain-containing protein [Sphingomonas sp.]|uniref:TonB-dependent receptor plug domain-containing protein n=1 Tax=Sphingomonas sp. TaxID=28214 RepID=UPI003F7E8B4E